MFLQFPPCYKDMSFWISDSFTENNLCEVVRGIAGDLVEEVCCNVIFCLFSLCMYVVLVIPFLIGDILLTYINFIALFYQTHIVIN